MAGVLSLKKLYLLLVSYTSVSHTEAVLFKQSLTANAYALPTPSEAPVTTETGMHRLY